MRKPNSHERRMLNSIIRTAQMMLDGEPETDEEFYDAVASINIPLKSILSDEQQEKFNQNELEAIYKIHIEDLDLSVRTYNWLKRHGINTVGEVISSNEEEGFNDFRTSVGAGKAIKEVYAAAQLRLDAVNERIERYSASADKENDK